MRFYYDIVFMNSTKLGGHNCTKFETKGDFLFVEGFDDIGDERKHWRFRYELCEIKEFRIEPMKEEEDYER